MKTMPWTFGALLLLSGSCASAQEPAKSPQTAFLDGERRIAFEMRRKPWNEVIEWLVDQTGLSYIGTEPPPAGSFNFISPKGATHSAAEVIDIINDGLLQHQYALIRRERSFTIVSADRQINPSNVARISVGDLKKRGTTEVVQVVVSLQALNAAEYAVDVKRQLGPLGSVMPLPVSNQLILQDSAANLLRIVLTIDDIEKNKTLPAPVTETIPLAVLDAARVAASLKAMLGDSKEGAPYIEGDASRNVLLIYGSKEQVRSVKNIIQALGENPTAAGSIRIIPLERGNAAILAIAIKRMVSEIVRGADIKVIVPGSDIPLFEPEVRPALKRPKQ